MRITTVTTVEQDTADTTDKTELSQPIDKDALPYMTQDNIWSIWNDDLSYYSSKFLIQHRLKSRIIVYVSSRVHNIISEIVRVIADHDITVSGYIDNVLLQHLNAHKDAINELYKRGKGDLI
jgi:hypothetical protein